MTIEQFAMYSAIVAVIFIWYSTATLQNKVLCVFRLPNKTQIEVFCKVKDRYVYWRGWRFKIDPARASLFWYDRGIHKFFPTRVVKYDFSWYSDVPHDPSDFKNTWDTPAARNMANSEEDWKAFNRGLQAQAGKKQGILQQYGLWIALAAIVILGFMFYQQGQQIAIIQNYLRAVPKP